MHGTYDESTKDVNLSRAMISRNIEDAYFGRNPVLKTEYRRRRSTFLIPILRASVSQIGGDRYIGRCLQRLLRIEPITKKA